MTGLFIGSFNPPTMAHFNIGKLLKEKAYLEKIVYVPVNSNKNDLVPLEKRITMLNMYTKDYDYLETNSIMLNNKKFNYLIIEELEKNYGNISLIIGSDLLSLLKNYDRYDYLLEKYHFYVIKRFDIDVKTIINKEYALYKNSFTIIDYDSKISSQVAKDKIKENQDTLNILDSRIREYIDKLQLFR